MSDLLVLVLVAAALVAVVLVRSGVGAIVKTVALVAGLLVSWRILAGRGSRHGDRWL